jgi:hypothetical protein
MKKVLFFLFLLSISCISSFAQSLKLSEISPSTNQFELYSPSPTMDLDCYSLVSVKYGNSGSATYYVVNFPNQTFAANNTSIPNYLVGGSTSNEFNWTNGTNYYVTKYSISTSGGGSNPPYQLTGGTGNPTTVTSSTELIFEAKPVVFLLKGNSVIDMFAAGIGTSLSAAQSEISRLPSLNLNPCSATGLQTVSFANTIQQTFFNSAAGNGNSYQWLGTVTNGSCSSNWSAATINLNAGTISGLSTWDDKYYQNISNSWVAITNTTNTFSSTSNSFVRDASNVITSVKFRVEVIDPTGFTVGENGIYPGTYTSTPAITVKKDNGDGIKNNSVFDSNDPIVIPQNISYVGSNIFEVTINYSDIQDNLSDDLFNLFIQMSVPTSPCFGTVSLLRFPTVSALPVTLSSLSLRHVNSLNELNWSTSSEQNNKGFEIQRSIGTTKDFRVIGFVGTKAKQGNSQTEISYSFEDANVKAGQTHYYRLNQIDFDGKSAFSPVKSIKPGSIESNLNVYPNPSQGSFTVNTGSNSGKLNIFVMDNTGRVVNQFMNVSTSNTRINNLKKGFYTLKIVNTESGEQSAQKIVVQ